MINENTRIGVVGLGLLGGSYIKGLKKAGYENLVGIDIDTEAVEYAKYSGWIKDGGDDPSLVKDCDLVVFALYPHVFVSWLQENQQYLKSGCLITDVTGVKRTVIAQVNSILRKDVEFIACHPMAGREYKGIQYSDETRFTSANFIIVPTASNTQAAIDTARQLAQILHFRSITTLTAEEHDRMIGYLSQLTHVIAVCLMNANDNPDLAQYTGDSFRDLTRIAKINENMWPELFILNKDDLSEELESFIHELQDFEDLLEREDVEGMKEKMIQSTKRRKEFDKA